MEGKVITYSWGQWVNEMLGQGFADEADVLEATDARDGAAQVKAVSVLDDSDCPYVWVWYEDGELWRIGAGKDFKVDTVKTPEAYMAKMEELKDEYYANIAD